MTDRLGGPKRGRIPEDPPVGDTAPGGGADARGVRWSLSAVLARQGFQMVCALVLARILGPESYGVISAATIYVSFTTLFLDQGLSASLIQRAEVSRHDAGATATLNILVGGLLAWITVAVAPLIATFFRSEPLEMLLYFLATSIPLKALQVTPRAMLSRDLLFRGVAQADIAGAASGASAGILAATLGAEHFSLAYQVIITDLVSTFMLMYACRGPLPNLRLRRVLPMLSFSSIVFFTNILSYFSRNIDNILVGRFLGVGSLSLYSMAYRIMVLPVQLVGQTLNRIMFPAFARSAKDPERITALLTKSMQFLSMTVIPAMAWVALAAPFLVELILGDAWLPAAPIVSVLAIGGARETIFYVTPSLMKGLGRGSMIIRYELLAAAVQVGGIVVGLQYGVLGVAIALVASGFALTPVLMVMQSRLTGVTLNRQLRICWPALHATVWASAAYAGIMFLPLSELVRGLLASGGFLVSYCLVLFLVHRPTLVSYLRQAKSLLWRGPVAE